MQIEVYRMDAEADSLTISLEAVCDSFSSLLWDIEYYQCGSFEVYIAANPENLAIFQTGRIVGRDDDSQHFGIIESVQIDTNAENGDYLTVKGRFLMCLLERRIIHPTYNVTAQKAYSEIVHDIVRQNTLLNDNRRIPGLSLGSVSGACWEQTATLQVSYENLMEWVYTICEKIGGTANIRLVKDVGETYKMVLDLAEGTDRSLLQEENPHIIFSDAYSNLLSFSYASDSAVTRNFAYIYGHGEGSERKYTTYCVTRWNDAYTTAMNLTERVGVNEGVFERFKTEILYDMQGCRTSISDILTRLSAVEETLSGVENALADIVEVSE